jgi:acetolactate synthase-1/2/3 large subunit
MKWSGRASDPARLPELFREALRHALTGAPGPVHIDVPTDILGAKAKISVAELDAGLDMVVPQHRPAPSAAAISNVLSALERSKRPLLIGGGGAVAADGGGAFRTLAERLGIPVLATQMGIGLLPTDHDLLVGSGGAISGPAACAALREADLIIALGCRFSSWMWPDGPPEWGEDDRHLVQIDIDPLAIGRNYPVSTGVIADAALAATAIAQAMQGRPLHTEKTWLAELKARRKAHRDMLDALASKRTQPIHPAALAHEVGRLLGMDGRVTFDGGHTSFWSNDFTPIAIPRTRFHEPGMAHLGFGLPWAMAMKKAFPGEQVVCITGDGALGFTVQELDTARRHKLPVIVIVHNNAAFGVIDFAQRKSGFSIGTDLGETDYAAVAQGFGCFGQVVTEIGGIESAFNAAVASGLPAVLDIRCRFDPHPMMPVFGRSTSAP